MNLKQQIAYEDEHWPERWDLPKTECGCGADIFHGRIYGGYLPLTMAKYDGKVFSGNIIIQNGNAIECEGGNWRKHDQCEHYIKAQEKKNRRRR